MQKYWKCFIYMLFDCYQFSQKMQFIINKLKTEIEGIDMQNHSLMFAKVLDLLYKISSPLSWLPTSCIKTLIYFEFW